MIARERSFWMLAVVVLALIALYLQQCRRPAVRTEYNEVVKRDTLYTEVRDTAIWKVLGEKVILYRDTGRVSLAYFPNRRVDTAAILRDYLATRYYEDTTTIKYGEIITRDSVRENKIVAHQVEHRLNIPVVRETVMLPPRTQVYVGLGMISGKNDFIHGFEGTLSLKNRADQIYQLGAVMEPGGAMYWKGAIMFKISLKRKGR